MDKLSLSIGLPIIAALFVFCGWCLKMANQKPVESDKAQGTDNSTN
jgi:urea transporter